MSPSLLRSLWALYRKDLAVWWGNRATIGASILPVVGFLIIQSIGVAAVGRNPVALVTLDTGPAGQQLRQILYSADVFRLTDATPDQAQALLHNLRWSPSSPFRRTSPSVCRPTTRPRWAW
jgi:hypothetical protein